MEAFLARKIDLRLSTVGYQSDGLVAISVPSWRVPTFRNPVSAAEKATRNIVRFSVLRRDAISGAWFF